MKKKSKKKKNWWGEHILYLYSLFIYLVFFFSLADEFRKKKRFHSSQRLFYQWKAIIYTWNLYYFSFFSFCSLDRFCVRSALNINLFNFICLDFFLAFFLYFIWFAKRNYYNSDLSWLLISFNKNIKSRKLLEKKIITRSNRV